MQVTVVFGGSGFVGRRVVAKFVAAGHHVIVPTRQRERIKEDLIVLPNTDVVACDPFDQYSLAKLVARAETVVNLVGILHETERGEFDNVHVECVRRLTDAVAGASNVRQLIHVSALNAVPGAPSRYLRSKGKGEAYVTKVGLTELTIIRPSVVFGAGDNFVNLFAKLLRLAPILFVPNGEARFQPIWVDDLADMIVACMHNPDCYGKVLSAGGPDELNLMEIVMQLRDAMNIKRKVFSLNSFASTMLATFMEFIPFLPPLLTRDNLASMSVPSVCDATKGNNAEALVTKPLTRLRDYLQATCGATSSSNSYNDFRHQARRN